MLEKVTIEKLVHGGQGLGTLADGKKVFVWNALPGEMVRVRLIRTKRSYAEGIAEEIIEASPSRVSPQEPEHYLSTSPWQIMEFNAENGYKKEITHELFQQAGVILPEFETTAVGPDWNYRNKMEYSFWGDEEGLHLALHYRGSHGKQVVTGSKLALPSLDAAAAAVLKVLNELNVRAGDLKTLIVRSTQDGVAAASLFVKPNKFPKFAKPEELKGLKVYHSNPKSPASVATKLIYEVGDSKLRDTLLGKPFVYDVNSFFQVNIPVFEAVLERMKEFLNPGELVDMYSGVGSIGLSLGENRVDLVELDPSACAMAMENAKVSGKDVDVIEASTDQALDFIRQDVQVVFDPPRSGLHQKVVDRILEAKPPKVMYLSCNPATQARDVALLGGAYTIKHFEVFNFFPHTPHIESLAILEKGV